jgi:ABC-type multidrug transport system ATPase subunit
VILGEFAATSGTATLAGLDIMKDIHKIRHKIGFCPQFDALFDLLTGREHLQLYAQIKGIKPDCIDSAVNAKISEMGLTEYADRIAGTYSGGA